MMKQEDIAVREHDRGALWHAFDQAGVAGSPAPPPDQPITAIDAAVAFVACSPSPLALIPLEDIIGVADQPNVPGTINEHPNWRRRFAKPAAELLQEPGAVERLRRVRETRR
jgi:4-alpha-glucanotransferase